jgi:hypothetical protein
MVGRCTGDKLHTIKGPSGLPDKEQLMRDVDALSPAPGEPTAKQAKRIDSLIRSGRASVWLACLAF